MHNTTTKLYGLLIWVTSDLGTRICVTRKYIAMDQDIYDLLMIAAGKEYGWSSDEIDDQLTRPRDGLFKSLANQEFYVELKKKVMDLKRDALFNTKRMGENYAI